MKRENRTTGNEEAFEIQVSGIDIGWNLKKGTCTFQKLPVAMMWVDTTLAGLMSGVQAMVGTERFLLALQSEGRKSVEADWQVILQFPNFSEGFNAIANIAAVAGWGEWVLVSLDEKKRECRFRIRDSWEGRYQKSLGVNWGSGMLAGKMAGYCSKLFETNCWADQTAFIDRGDAFDEFVVRPSARSLETELENLLGSNEATRADMAVALQRLKKEIDERMRVQEILRQSEERYRQISKCVPDLIWAIDLSGRFTYANPAVERTHGWTVEEFMKLNFREKVSPQQAAKNTKMIEEELAKATSPQYDRNTVRTFESEELRKDGSTFWAEVSAAFLWSDDGTPVGIIGTTRDITDRKRAEETLRHSHKRTNDILESISDGFFSLDKGMVVTYFNNAAGKILGRNRNEVLGRNLFDAFPEARGSIFEEKYAKALREGKFISFEVYFEPQPYQNWYDVRVFPYEEGISVYFQVTTESRRAEEALRQANDELEQRVAERTEELRLAVDALQEEVSERQQAEAALQESEARLRDLAQRLLIFQEKERQALSRELQEDLAQSIAALKLQLRSFEQQLPAGAKVLRGEYRQAMETINGLVAKMRLRAAELSPQMLADLGLNVALKSLCEGIGIECILVMHDLSQLFTPNDQVSIYRIIEEAMKNINQHAQASQVTLMAKKKGDWVDFLVGDNGKGFDFGQMKDLEAGWKGIGLAAMSERVRALGGTFKMESQIGVGTRIFFSLPRTLK